MRAANTAVDIDALAAELRAVLPDPRDFVAGLRSKGGGEVAGPCPFCQDGEDRFFIRADGSFMCRQCGAQGGDAIDFFRLYDRTDFMGLSRKYLNGSHPPVTPTKTKSKVYGDHPHQEKKTKRLKAQAIPQNLTATYLYQDEQGKELFQVRRYEEVGREKTFRQGHVGVDGKFIFSLKGVRRVLYRLPEVVKAGTIFLAEGEKDADRLTELGLVGTTSPMGASNWRADLYAEQLKGKDVIIVPDNDPPGQKYAAKAADDLDGVAKSVKIVNLPGLPFHGDVSDWLDAGGTKEQLLKIVANAPLYKQPAEPAPKPKVEKSNEWPEPINIFDEFSIGDPEWQYSYCPPVISDFAFDEAERMGVRPEQVAGPAIISAAGVIDDRIQLQPKRFDETWVESARLWGAVIGGSGEKKSPAKNRADVAINEIEKSLYRQHCDQMRLYEVELQQYEALSKKGRANTSPPVEPVRERVICNDTTVEALRDILCDGGGATKITCLWDELSGMLSTFDAYRQSKGVSRDRSLYLELFNGGSKPIDRSGKVNIFVPNWSACISGTITPEVMTEYFGKLNADGLLQRFLLYRAERMGRGVDRMPNEAAEARFKATIKRLFACRTDIPQTVVRLSEDAQAVRESFDKLVELAYHLPGNTPAFNAHLNKFPGIFCRLTLTYHMFACFDAENPNMGLTVDGSTAEMAAKALIEYHLPAAREFYRKIGFTDHGQEAVKSLCGFILAKGLDKISSRDISAGVRALRGNTIQVREAMDFLEVYHWVRPIKSAAGKTTVWSINPAVHTRYVDQASHEKARRDACVAKIKEATSVFQCQEEQHGIF